MCVEIGELGKHGISLPPNMQGLTEEQVVELKLKDEWQAKCIPSGGVTQRKDDIGRRSGQGQCLYSLPSFIPLNQVEGRILRTHCCFRSFRKIQLSMFKFQMTPEFGLNCNYFTGI